MRCTDMHPVSFKNHTPIFENVQAPFQIKHSPLRDLALCLGMHFYAYVYAFVAFGSGTLVVLRDASSHSKTHASHGLPSFLAKQLHQSFICSEEEKALDKDLESRGEQFAWRGRRLGRQ